MRGSRLVQPDILGPKGSAFLGLAIGTFCLFLAAAVVAFATPEMRDSSERIPIAQEGTFSYGSDVPVSAAYPDGKLHTGQPAFFSQVASVDFAFQYQFIAGAPHAIDGTIQVNSVVRNPATGWSSISPVVPPTAFQGDRAGVSWSVDMNQLLSLIDTVEAHTNARSPTYDAEFVVLVEVRGTVAGQPLQTQFVPGFPGRIQPQVAFQILQPASTVVETDEGRFHTELPVMGDPGDAWANATHPVMNDVVLKPTREPNDVKLLGAHVAITDLRVAAVGGAAASGTLVLVLVGWLLLAAQSDEGTKLLARYADQIITVPSVGVRENEHVVEVMAFEDLLRVAGLVHAQVLHESRSDGHVFLTRDGFVAYRYEVGVPTTRFGKSFMGEQRRHLTDRDLRELARRATPRGLARVQAALPDRADQRSTGAPPARAHDAHRAEALNPGEPQPGGRRPPLLLRRVGIRHAEWGGRRELAE